MSEKQEGPFLAVEESGISADRWKEFSIHPCWLEFMGVVKESLEGAKDALVYAEGIRIHVLQGVAQAMEDIVLFDAGLTSPQPEDE